MENTPHANQQPSRETGRFNDYPEVEYMASVMEKRGAHDIGRRYSLNLQETASSCRDNGMSSEVNSRCCKVYGLKSSRDDSIRYIGQTTQSVQRRYHQHLADAKNCFRSNSYCHKWIRKELAGGYQIKICVLKYNCAVNLDEMEAIALFKGTTHNLTNLNIGGTCGNFGRRLSEETKQKMRHPRSEQTKMRMRKPRTEAHRAAMSAALVGNCRSRGERNRTAVLRTGDVLEIRYLLECGFGVVYLAKCYSVKKACISKIKHRITWKHLL